MNTYILTFVYVNFREKGRKKQMNLKFDISDETIKQMHMLPDERIYYAIPYDVNKDGDWCHNGMCVVECSIWQGEL